MNHWTGLAPREFESPFPGSLIPTFLTATGDDSGDSATHATHCATYYTPCRPLLRAFSGWILTPPPTAVACQRNGPCGIVRDGINGMDRFAGRIHEQVEELSEEDPSVKAFVEWSAS